MTSYYTDTPEMVALMARRSGVPCEGRDEWTSEDAEVRAEAARLCLGCPVAGLCGAAAVAERVTWGVWGGVDYSRVKVPRRKPPLYCPHGHRMTEANTLRKGRTAGACDRGRGQSWKGSADDHLSQ